MTALVSRSLGEEKDCLYLYNVLKYSRHHLTGLVRTHQQGHFLLSQVWKQAPGGGRPCPGCWSTKGGPALPTPLLVVLCGITWLHLSWQSVDSMVCAAD